MEFRKLLCVCTDTGKCDEVLSHGVNLAQHYQAELHVLLALEALPPNAKMVMESASYVDSKVSIEQHAQDWLHDKLTEWEPRYSMTGSVSVGNIIDSIEEVVENHAIDLVIKPASEDFLDRLFGTDEMHLLRGCSCPVLFTHEKLPGDYQNIVVAVDANYHYSDDEAQQRHALNTKLISHGMTIAEREKAHCHIISVFDVYPPALLGDGFISVPQEAMEEEAQTVREEQLKIMQQLVAEIEQPGTPSLHVVQGNPRSELVDEAKRLNADLVIMGTLARTGINGLLMGNTAESVLSQLNCAVLVQRGDGH